VFVREEEPRARLHALDWPSGSPVPLFDNPAGDEEPDRSPTGEAVAFSPDGSRIALGTIHEGDWELSVMNADGSGLRRLTTSPGFDGAPLWLPAVP
jgi:hypothetical protein